MVKKEEITMASEIYMDWEEVNEEGFSMITTYNEGADQAIVAEKDGVCYGVFRGSDPNLNDWKQNFDVRESHICQNISWENYDVGKEEQCCKVTRGYYDAYHANYRENFEADLRACAQSCDESHDSPCNLILAGHSQGGAIAIISAMYLSDLKPVVITFGQPPVLLDHRCTLIDSSRVLRFINSVNIGNIRSFDPIPFLSNIYADFLGHTVLLSGSEGGTAPGGIAYLGLDFQKFNSMHLDLSTRAHTTTSYINSIRAILNVDVDNVSITNPLFPIASNGFSDGTTCANSDFICASKRCDGVCKPQHLNCSPCNENSDCLSNYCIGGGCAEAPKRNNNNLATVESGCPCLSKSDCMSGRCEFTSFFSLSRICSDKLEEGLNCNEDNDCISGKCSWRGKCVL